MLSELIHKYNWAFFKPLLIETWLYLLVGAVVFAVLLYFANKILKVKIKWSIAFIVLLLLTQYFWYKHSSTLNVLAGHQPMSTQIGVIDQATHQIKGNGQNGFLAYGPYMPLAKGVYKVTFKIQLANPNNQVVGFCDVNVLEHPESNIRTELVLDGFKKQNPQDVTLVYTIPEGNPKVEFRVFQYGGNALTLAGLHLAPAGIREVLLKNKDYLFKGAIYILGALFFIAIYLKFLSRVKEISARKILGMTSFIAVLSGLIMALIWRWKGFSQYSFQSYYDMWRVFYAPAWLALMFIFFNFLYLINGHLGFNKETEKYLKYDRYTLLVIPAFIITELLVKTINTHLLLGNFYLGTLAVKSVIYFIFLWQNLKEQQNIQSNKAVKWTILLSVFIVYMLITPWHNACFFADGDEIRYIMKTQSLLKHEAMVNVLKRADYLSFHSAIGWVDWGDVNTFYGQVLAPGFLLGERLGASITMNMFGALLALNVFLLIYRINKSIESSFIGMIITAFSCPLGIYSILLYPEILSAFIILYLIRKIVNIETISRLEILAIIIGAIGLIFIKERFIIITIITFMFLIYNLRKDFKLLFPVIGVFIGGLAVFFLFDKYLHNFDISNKLLKYSAIYWSQKKIYFSGLLGQLLDQESGLFIYAPFYIFSFFGLISLIKQSSKNFVIFLFFLMPYYMAVSSFDLWSSLGGSPAPRYIVAVVPVLAVSFGVFWANSRKVWLKILSLISLLWAFLMYYMLTLLPQYSVHSPNNITGRNEILDRLYAAGLMPNLSIFFPSFQKTVDTDLWLTLIIILVFIVIMVLYLKQISAGPEGYSKNIVKRLGLRYALVLVIMFYLAGFMYYNHQEFAAIDCYSGGGGRLIDSQLLNGGGFFVLTKVALRKGESMSITVTAKGICKERWPYIRVMTGTDQQRKIVGEILINNNQWREYTVFYKAEQGGLLPFWFEHANYQDGRELYISNLIFSEEKQNKILGFIYCQLGKLDTIMGWDTFAQKRFFLSSKLGYR